LGSYRFGPFADAFLAHAPAVALLSAAILAWEIGIMGLGLEKILLARYGKADSPRWSPAAAMNALLAETASRRRLPHAAVTAWYGFYFLAWAPLAEELFFWGYLYPALRLGNGAVTAGLITAFIFAIRHALHFLFLPGPFPYPAAAALAVSTAGAALLNGWLFEVTQSLWPLVALHLASNLASLAIQPGPKAPLTPVREPAPDSSR
jgi:membrane protease YdiL (CAAX protease family)